MVMARVIESGESRAAAARSRAVLAAAKGALSGTQAATQAALAVASCKKFSLEKKIKELEASLEAGSERRDFSDRNVRHQFAKRKKKESAKAQQGCEEAKRTGSSES